MGMGYRVVGIHDSRIMVTFVCAHVWSVVLMDADSFGKLTRFFNSDEDDEFVGESFQRVQFNLAGSRLKKILENPNSGCWEAGSRDGNFEIIFGGPYNKHGLMPDQDTCISFSHRRIAPLFDSSGGRGVVEKSWPKIPHHEYGPIWCGYAGGLGPDNIKEELQKIEEAVGEAEIWIDMETKLRNKKDQFDLNLCEQVLQEAEPYVEVSS